MSKGCVKIRLRVWFYGLKGFCIVGRNHSVKKIAVFLIIYVRTSTYQRRWRWTPYRWFRSNARTPYYNWKRKKDVKDGRETHFKSQHGGAPPFNISFPDKFYRNTSMHGINFGFIFIRRDSQKLMFGNQYTKSISAYNKNLLIILILN